MSATIKEIAADLGISHVTVSYALRGTGRVGEETRRRVLEAAARVGYRPNASAQATRTGRFGRVHGPFPQDLGDGGVAAQLRSW